MMTRTQHLQELTSTKLYSAIGSETNSVLSTVDFRVADAIFQAESTNNCYIREGVLIPRLGPQASARVIQPFTIQLFRTEEGYIAVSDLCKIFELEKTMGEAARSYFYSCV